MDLLEPIHIADLIVRSFADDLSLEEEKILYQWRKESEANEKLYQQIVSLKGLPETEQQTVLFSSKRPWKVFYKQIYARTTLVISRRILKYAALLIPFGLAFGLWWYSDKSGEPVTKKTEMAALPNIQHGSSKAILVLNDGSQLDLEQQTEFSTGDATVQNAGNTGTISYNKGGNKTETSPKMNKLIIPNGGEYTIELADGTTVYLNAGSELSYPVNFVGNLREVSLKGEAYFKVARNEICPFVVNTAGMKVQVLGTEFNLNAYEGQAYTATTLVKGSVEIQVDGGASVKLEPDQQARFDKTTAQVECLKVNTLPYTAWKDGKFVFYHESLGAITTRLEKWYDVTIVYSEEKLKALQIFGIISRYEDIHQVLELLKSTQTVDFNYVDGKIEVVSYHSR